MYDNVVVQKGSNVTLTCQGSIDPDEKVSWNYVHHYHIIPRNVTNKKYMEKPTHWTGERTFSLHITNVSKTDVGKYKCTVYFKGLNTPLEDFIKLKFYESGK